ncbi:MarR family winged helix-turn-helix transcriptional regulator [Pseudonocardia sp. TRM90224]|uniref:MarR family winged helix-turn-helix transcriptional regulator n=1 Tax=Pseudonocardia sp. TRM90224 TaxID=2812678 RepID=UPI001E358AC2|nr:MarR family transcriptional regulator [Pseudonocardia sp. TRM90224]
MTLDDAVRAMLLLLPRLVGRTKRLPLPEQLRALDLAPRHLSLLAYLQFDGPQTVSQLAERLEVAPTTVSLMVADLSRAGVLVRTEDEADRRRRIVGIAPEHADMIDASLATSARAWTRALEGVSAEQRRTVVEVLRTFEEALGPEAG